MTFDTFTFPDFIGLVGVGLILIVFGALTLERIDPKGWRYNAGNGLGALLILISLLFSFNLASFVMGIAWLGFSLFGLWKAWKR